MKKKILKILILIIIVLAIVITTFAIRKKTYNKIEENWILKISPSYLSKPPNAVYLYEDSYVITNCFTTSKWQNIVHKRGSLTNKVNDNLITKIKQEANQKLEKGEVIRLFSVTLNSGEKITLTADTESINEILDMINYDRIWYAQDY